MKHLFHLWTSSHHLNHPDSGRRPVCDFPFSLLAAFWLGKVFPLFLADLIHIYGAFFFCKYRVPYISEYQMSNHNSNINFKGALYKTNKMLMNAFFTVWWSCKVRRDRQQNAECQILCDRRTKLIKMSNCFSREGLRARELDDTFHNLQRKNIVGWHGNHHLPELQLINHHRLTHSHDLPG